MEKYNLSDMLVVEYETNCHNLSLGGRLTAEGQPATMLKFGKGTIELTGAEFKKAVDNFLETDKDARRLDDLRLDLDEEVQALKDNPIDPETKMMLDDIALDHAIKMKKAKRRPESIFVTTYQKQPKPIRSLKILENKGTSPTVMSEMAKKDSETKQLIENQNKMIEALTALVSKGK